jgi:hypothetical protein
MMLHDQAKCCTIRQTRARMGISMAQFSIGMLQRRFIGGNLVGVTASKLKGSDRATPVPLLDYGLFMSGLAT